MRLECPIHGAYFAHGDGAAGAECLVCQYDSVVAARERLPLSERLRWKLRAHLRDLREGARLLAAVAREVKRLYLDELPATLDDATARIRENTGQDPDWDVERRRAKRRTRPDE